MRGAVVILSMVAAIAAEAPYHLPRPAAHAPKFSYPAAPAPPPPPPPHPPQPQQLPQVIHYPPQPAIAPQSIQSHGYHYQQPNIAPAYLQSAPIPQPQFHSYPPAPQPVPAAPSHSLVSYPQIQYARPQQQQIQQTQPSFTYSQPQTQVAPATRPDAQAYPIQPLPAGAAPQPHPQLVPFNAPPPYYPPQATPQQGYANHQPHATISYTPQLPLQTQSFSNNIASSALSSYQADSNQYNGQFVNNEPLDSTVVNRVENIIKENEHASARNAGYVSLVSGVSLEGARPSIEISSFVHNSPLLSSKLEQTSGSSSSSSSSSSSQAGSASEAASTPSQDYGFPTITANSQATHAESNHSFLPQDKPATTYGSP